MPVYCFKNEDGEIIERVFPAGQAPGRIRVDGVKYKRSIAAEHSGYRHAYGTWQLLSDAAGVHPDQIPDAMEEARRKGVSISFTEDGRAIFTSARHRKKYCEAIGLYDRNGGYSDPQRRAPEQEPQSCPEPWRVTV